MFTQPLYHSLGLAAHLGCAGLLDHFLSITTETWPRPLPLPHPLPTRTLVAAILTTKVRLNTGTAKTLTPQTTPIGVAEGFCFGACFSRLSPKLL